MTSLSRRTLATFAALALGACAPGRTVVPARSPELTFANEAPVTVTVSLVGERREWRLGRVAPGARTTLRVPVAADTAGLVQLVVRADPPATLQPLREPGVAVTAPQPLTAMREQRWTFTQRQLAAPTLLGSAVAPRIR